MSVEMIKSSTAIELSEQELDAVAGGCGSRQPRPQPAINIGILQVGDNNSAGNNSLSVG